MSCWRMFNNLNYYNYYFSAACKDSTNVIIIMKRNSVSFSVVLITFKKNLFLLKCER